MTEAITAPADRATDGTDDGRDDGTEPEKGPGWIRTVLTSVWFPAFFVVGFLVFYLLPFHAPSPHHMPVAVVGQSAAAQVGQTLEQSRPGAFDIVPVPDGAAALTAIQNRTAVGAYDPATRTLSVANATGLQQTQVLQQTFGAVAGGPLTVTDVAPTAPNDATGTGLFYLVMIWNISGYILVMMLMQSTFGRRGKLLTMVGFGAVVSVATWLVGRLMGVLPGNAAVIGVAFLLTQAVGWTVYGVAPLVKRALPAVAMGLFVLLSIPSSNGAIGQYLVPGFFQFLHPIMPLGNAVDAARSVLYLDAAALTRPLLVLVAWWAAGAALVGLDVWRSRRAARAAEEPAETPPVAPENDVAEELAPGRSALVGRVVDEFDKPLADARITVMDVHGHQVDVAATAPDGEFAAVAPARSLVTVIANSGAHEPELARVYLREPVTHRDFRLRGQTAEEAPSAAAAAAVITTGG